MNREDDSNVLCTFSCDLINISPIPKENYY